jgi:hypothetical protein
VSSNPELYVLFSLSVLIENLVLAIAPSKIASKSAWSDVLGTMVRPASSQPRKAFSSDNFSSLLHVMMLTFPLNLTRSVRSRSVAKWFLSVGLASC